MPELIFGHLLTSSNYDDDEKKVSHSCTAFANCCPAIGQLAPHYGLSHHTACNIVHMHSHDITDISSSVAAVSWPLLWYEEMQAVLAISWLCVLGLRTGSVGVRLLATSGTACRSLAGAMATGPSWPTSSPQSSSLRPATARASTSRCGSTCSLLVNIDSTTQYPEGLQLHQNLSSMPCALYAHSWCINLCIKYVSDVWQHFPTRQAPETRSTSSVLQPIFTSKTSLRGQQRLDAARHKWCLYLHACFGRTEAFTCCCRHSAPT